MMAGQRVVVVLPAYNAAQTLAQTVAEIPRDVVDEVVLVDDASSDDTVALARTLNIEHVLEHDLNQGYGANQKTCYQRALALGGDIIIMLHPDYQYSPKLIPAMAGMIASDLYAVVLGSRILGGDALSGGMPLYKYIANRGLTAFQNLCSGAKLSEYHTGYRAFSAASLQTVDLSALSDDFVFDNELLGELIRSGQRIGEISCPTRYFDEASSINLQRSVVYGLGVLRVSVSLLVGRVLGRPPNRPPNRPPSRPDA